MNKRTKELNRHNNELDKQINAENHEAFTDMICYLRGADISEYNQEVVRQDLLEMLLSAQNRGENIHSVIGEDYKPFCDDVIASLPSKTAKQKVIDFFNIICWCLSILGAIDIIIADETIALLRDLAAGRPLNFDISVSVGSAIAAGIVIAAAFIIAEVLMKNSFKTGKKKNGSGVKAFGAGAGMMALFLLIAWLGKATLFTVNIFVACAVILALYITHRMLARL